MHTISEGEKVPSTGGDRGKALSGDVRSIEWRLGEIFPQGRNEALQALIYRARLQAEALLKCQYCGTKNDLTRILCKKCGRKLPSAKEV